MPRVDFYLLHDQDPGGKFTCTLSAKIVRQGLNIHIHTDSRDTAISMDDYLWTYKDVSFLPHKLVDDRDQLDTPITIGWDGCNPGNNDVLINLGLNIPEFANTFDRIIEIVTTNDLVREQARDRYRQYRDMDFELHNHDMEPKHANT